MKLGIGTAQFGMDYGIANPAGRVPADEVASILQLATKKRVRYIDTAPAYGGSEETLGKLMDGSSDFRIITKTLPFEPVMDGKAYARSLIAAFKESLARLGTGGVYGLLVHHAAALTGPGAEYVFAALQELKGQGDVLKVGASIYDGTQIERIFDRFALDIVQLPVSVFDQRLIQSGHLVALKRAGIEIHARSVFLQGLMFLEPRPLDTHFTPALKQLERIRGLAHLLGTTIERLALSFVICLAEVDVAVCGVNNLAQFRALLEAAENPAEFSDADVRALAVSDPAILNPSLWPQAAVAH